MIMLRFLYRLPEKIHFRTDIQTSETAIVFIPPRYCNVCFVCVELVDLHGVGRTDWCHQLSKAAVALATTQDPNVSTYSYR